MSVRGPTYLEKLIWKNVVAPFVQFSESFSFSLLKQTAPMADHTLFNSYQISHPLPQHVERDRGHSYTHTLPYLLNCTETPLSV